MLGKIVATIVLVVFGFAFVSALTKNKVNKQVTEENPKWIRAWIKLAEKQKTTS